MKRERMPRNWLALCLAAGMLTCSDGTAPTQPSPQLATITNVAPIADAGGAYTHTHGYSFKPDGSASIDPDEPTYTLKYLWNFGDGTTTTLAKPAHTYSTTGVYTLTLRVTDRLRGVGWDTTTVTIQNLKPVANPGGPYTATINVSIRLSGVGSTDDRPTSELKYLWLFHDGTTSTSSAPSKTYKALGVFTVRLAVKDKYGLWSDTVSTTVTVEPVNQAPVARHGGPYADSVDVPIAFDGTASSDPDGHLPLTYAWTFGDGGVSTEAQPSHTYTSAGTFTVSLNVKDAKGKSSLTVGTTATVSGANQAPVANAGGPYSGTAGSAVAFDGSASSDPDNNTPLTYAWDFGDDSTGNGATPSHPYATAGSYTVTLTVTDAEGLSSAAATSSASIAAPNQAPVANAGGPYSGTAGSAVAFDGSACTDPDSNLPLSYTWNFGDGNTGTDATPSHTYAAAGTYTVTLTVTDAEGLSSAAATSSASIAAPNQAPVANAGGPYTGIAGSAVAFDGSASTDPDSNLPLSYTWNFGDGNTGTDATPSHTYATAGSYTVTLTVTNATGLSSAPATTNASIAAPNQAPVANAGGPYSGIAGSAVAFDGSASSDPDNNTPLTYAWDFGDGSTGTGATPSHTYAAAGTYTVTLTDTDAEGLSSAAATAAVTVAEPLFLIKDEFSRVVSEHWGTADIGGMWKIQSSSAPRFGVDGARGNIIAQSSNPQNVAGAGLETYGLDVTGLLSFSLDRAPDTTPEGVNLRYVIQVYARRNDRVTDGNYYYRFWIRPGLTNIELRIEKNVNGVLTQITGGTQVPGAFDPNAKFWVRWECFGTSPATTVRMRVWQDGTTEPTIWHRSVVVDEPGLDLSGTTGVRFKTDPDQLNYPVNLYIDKLEYKKISP